MIEKIGGLTFKDGVLVGDLDVEAEIAKRGGMDEMLAQSVERNPFMRAMLKKKPKNDRDPS